MREGGGEDGGRKGGREGGKEGRREGRGREGGRGEGGRGEGGRVVKGGGGKAMMENGMILINQEFQLQQLVYHHLTG